MVIKWFEDGRLCWGKGKGKFIVVWVEEGEDKVIIVWLEFVCVVVNVYVVGIGIYNFSIFIFDIGILFDIVFDIFIYLLVGKFIFSSFVIGVW